MDVLHIEQLLYYQRHSLCGLELHEIFDWRAMTPDIHRGNSLIQCCLTANPYTYIHAIWYATAHDSKTHIAYNCTTHQTMVLLPMIHHFIRTSLASYSVRVAMSFQL